MADPPPAAIFHFPGVAGVKTAEFTLSHGISPSVAVLQVSPLSSLSTADGTLTIEQGNTRIQFPNCRADVATLMRDGSGQIVRVSIWDRRWKWKFGAISGRYNVRRDDGSLVLDTERTPEQLAKLCLDAMGEQGYVVQMPGKPRPGVEWDYDVPAYALARLCDEMGCRVVLGIDNRVYVLPAGEGTLLPDGPQVSDQRTLDPADGPDEIAIVTAPVRFQADFDLEAVGEDADGSIKPIDQLSYKPAGGWGPSPFHQVVGNDTGNEAKIANGKRAERHVFRTYRISGPFPMDLPGSVYFTFPGNTPVEVRTLEQILPIEPVQVEMVDEVWLTLAGKKPKAPKPAQVWGLWQELAGKNANATEPTKDPGAQDFLRQFTIDAERGLVHFADRVALAPNGRMAPAKLKLRCAFSVRDAKTGGPLRWVFLGTGGVTRGTRPRYVIHDDIVFSIRKTPLTFVDNYNEVRRDAEEFYAEELKQYQFTHAQTIVYGGIRAITLDGARDSISWSIGRSDGPTTTVSYNDERTNARITPYKQRREREKVVEFFRNAVASELQKKKHRGSQ